MLISLPVVLVLLSASPAPTSPQGQELEEAAPHLLELDSPDKGYWNYPVRIVDRQTAEAATFDPRTDPPATIAYRLTRDGTIRVRVVWRSEPRLVLRTLLDWVHQEFGRHELRWDGRDGSGQLVDNRACLITFEGDDPGHRGHPPETCHELEVALSLPAGRDEVAELAQIAGRITRATPYGHRGGFTLRAYVDHALAAETRIPAGKLTFALPSHPIAAGEHLVTVNVEDGEGHLGVASLRLRSPARDSVERGEAIFFERGCDRCHDLTHTAWQPPGPGLAYLGSRRPRPYLRRLIADPASAVKAARMPGDSLSEDEIEAVVEFLASLRRPPTARAGREIFAEEGCADCHEAEEETGALAGPDLRRVGELRSRDYFAAVVRDPQAFYPRTAMPPTLLNPGELERLTAYLAARLPSDRAGS